MTGGRATNPESSPASDPEADAESAGQTRAQVRRALEQGVSRVDSPETAEAIAERLERLSAGSTEFDRAQKAAREGTPPGREVQRAAAAPDTVDEATSALLKAAETATPVTPRGAAVVQGALDALAPGQAAPAPEVERGRTLLKDAVLRRMGPLQRLDATIYLAINGAPRAPWTNRVGNLLTVFTTGGWIWAGCLLVARFLGVRRARGALWDFLPSVVAATWIVEHPAKAVFRRRRPFVDIVRALVVGKKPGSWSFPSGHTASSFASAWMLSKRWPRHSPLFFAVASTVGVSRVYVGAHYPGDVAVGAMAGMGLAEGVHRIVRPLRLQYLTRRLLD